MAVGIQTKKAHEALNSQSGLGGHDRLTGSTSYYFDGTSGDASFAYDSNAINAPNCWFALKPISGDITITTTNANGDGLSADVIQQGDVYYGPVTVISGVLASDVILAYPV